jgi:catechol 2,3-dioxygenase-like lactoylglutathione lyase family enzyme
VITGFLHVGLSTQDAQRSLAFYRDVFGMQLVSDREVPKGGYVEKVTGVAGACIRIVHLQGHGFNLELLEYVEPGGESRSRRPNDTGSAHLCFVADDLAAECARLRSLGVRILSEGGRAIGVTGGPNDGGKCVYAEDPDGNAVEIVELVRPWPSAP